MLVMYKLALYGHIVCGSIALLLFWYPLFLRKGSELHIRFGGYYVKLMYIVSWSGVVCCGLVLWDPLAIRMPGDMSALELQDFLSRNRQFAIFLLTLSLLTLSSVYHGVKVLAAKANRDLLKSFPHVTLLLTLLVCSCISLQMGVKANDSLLIGFSLVGLATAINNLRYIYKSTIKQREWIVAHIGGLLGSGIGVYTAFSAVGGRHILLNVLGAEAIMISWIAPGILGTVAIIWASRRFSVKYKIV